MTSLIGLLPKNILILISKETFHPRHKLQLIEIFKITNLKLLETINLSQLIGRIDKIFEEL